MITGLTEEEYRSLAISLIEEIEHESEFFTSHKFNTVPKLKRSNLDIGDKIGEGGFSCVYQVKSLKDIYSFIHHDTSYRDKLGLNYSFGGQKKCLLSETSDLDDHFVIKELKDISTSHRSTRSAIDLSYEIKFLSALSHKNIINIFGISENDISSFILLERLKMNLKEKLQEWKILLKRNSIGFSVVSHGRKENNFLERLTIGRDLCSVYNHLHQRRLIYRDIKPENIGFDENDIVKIYDFGLCKELRSKYLTSNASHEQKFYKLTEFVGTIPYMAPEVFHGKPYNELADVHSFGMLLYEIVFLKSIKKWMRFNSVEKKIYKINARPDLPQHICSAKLANIIRRSWSGETKLRPNLSQIYEQLSIEIEAQKLSINPVDFSKTVIRQKTKSLTFKFCLKKI